ncbi:MAG TPA: enolase C-terminal domain-like protein [Pirellulales bacterium]|nr:enolase C-terminal domain-like protein [Pirellulales bacterium]
MSKLTDIRAVAARLYFLPVRFRMPLKFGTEVTTSVTCARVCLEVEDRAGRRGTGWGESPLAVQWGWPSESPYSLRHEQMKEFCRRLTAAWSTSDVYGHPLELGDAFLRERLPSLHEGFVAEQAVPRETTCPHMPHLAALICLAPFDIALHDALGNLAGCDTYRTYGPDFVKRDLASYFQSSASAARFRGRTVADFLVADPPARLPAWHLVGGLDPLDGSELKGDEPRDGYPVTLVDWIERDGLTCLKIKLRGNDAGWDYARLVQVGRIAGQRGIAHLSADFNCTVTDPAYVCDVVDRLRVEEPTTFERIRYIEQPFPYDLDAWPIDVRSVAKRKPLLLDESAHDWRKVEQGRELGWSGVALKTCKTQTGALLSLCWAKAHDMPLMVQDLTNPMLAQIPHVRLAAHAGTMMGVETNAMQFYPEVSRPEAAVHPGLYQRRQGLIDLSTLGRTGFGYRLDEIDRPLPPSAAEWGSD